MVIPFEDVRMWGSFPGSVENGFSGTSFWVVFAIFFPAATGIMAGAQPVRRPEEPTPEHSPRHDVRHWREPGNLPGAGVLAGPVGDARGAGRQLHGDDRQGSLGPAVLAGLLGATLSSALSSLVGSARILQAMGDHRVLPKSGWLAYLSPKGEPHHAMMVTGALVGTSLLLRDLNVVAPLITMFYLITYAMLNLVVLIEQSMGLVSFRPLLRVPRWVSAAGLVGSTVTMFIIHPVFSLTAVAVVLLFYVLLLRRRLEAPFGDMRSGLFVTAAEWAAKKVAVLPQQQERAWKPNILVPVEDPRSVRGSFMLLHDVAYPKGSVKLMGLRRTDAEPGLEAGVVALNAAFRDREVVLVVDGAREAGSLRAGTRHRDAGASRRVLQAEYRVSGSAGNTDDREQDYAHIQEEAGQNKIGVLVHAAHPKSGLGERRTINLWIRDRSPDWRIRMKFGNLDLPDSGGLQAAEELECTHATHHRRR